MQDYAHLSHNSHPKITTFNLTSSKASEKHDHRSFHSRIHQNLVSLS